MTTKMSILQNRLENIIILSFNANVLLFYVYMNAFLLNLKTVFIGSTNYTILCKLKVV